MKPRSNKALADDAAILVRNALRAAGISGARVSTDIIDGTKMVRLTVKANNGLDAMGHERWPWLNRVLDKLGNDALRVLPSWYY